MGPERYFLRADGYEWREVSEREWIQRERMCGFRPKGGGDGKATGGFSGMGWQGAYTVPENHAALRAIYPDLPE